MAPVTCPGRGPRELGTALRAPHSTPLMEPVTPMDFCHQWALGDMSPQATLGAAWHSRPEHRVERTGLAYAHDGQGHPQQGLRALRAVGGAGDDAGWGPLPRDGGSSVPPRAEALGRGLSRAWGPAPAAGRRVVPEAAHTSRARPHHLPEEPSLRPGQEPGAALAGHSSRRTCPCVVPREVQGILFSPVWGPHKTGPEGPQVRGPGLPAPSSRCVGGSASCRSRLRKPQFAAERCRSEASPNACRLHDVCPRIPPDGVLWNPPRVRGRGPHANQSL